MLMYGFDVFHVHGCLQLHVNTPAAEGVNEKYSDLIKSSYLKLLGLNIISEAPELKDLKSKL